MERTLLFVKPDGVQRGLVGEIVRRVESKGLKLIGLKMLRITPDMAARHYAEHQGKGFYEGLVRFITSGPVVAMAVEGPSAVAQVRGLMGATNPANSAPGTIRGDLAVDIAMTVVHGSDSPERALQELELFFDARELVHWDRTLEGWIVES
jgi:nucleoside-diphosphate kinase